MARDQRTEHLDSGRSGPQSTTKPVGAAPEEKEVGGPGGPHETVCAPQLNATRKCQEREVISKRAPKRHSSGQNADVVRGEGGASPHISKHFQKPRSHDVTTRRCLTNVQVLLSCTVACLPSKAPERVQPLGATGCTASSDHPAAPADLGRGRPCRWPSATRH